MKDNGAEKLLSCNFVIFALSLSLERTVAFYGSTVDYIHSMVVDDLTSLSGDVPVALRQGNAMALNS